MIASDKVSACLVTRGDIDMQPVLNSLPFEDVIVWDNSKREDFSCYGRFAAAQEAKHDWIYVQDDDIIVPIPGFLRWCDPDFPGVQANKKHDEEWRFLGIGAVFPKRLIDFSAYLDAYGFDADFCRVADVVFGYGHPYRSDWFGYGELEWSRAANRMYHQPDHYTVRERARERMGAKCP